MEKPVSLIAILFTNFFELSVELYIQMLIKKFLYNSICVVVKGVYVLTKQYIHGQID